MTSLILATGARAVFHTTLLVSVYFLFVGHNAPGGGFIGGLVGGAAFVLRRLAAPAEPIASRVRPTTLLGLGILLAGTTGFAGYLLGGAFLASGYTQLALPLLGKVSVTSVLAFDVGVYLVVVGLVLMVLEMLGAPAARGEDTPRPSRAPTPDSASAPADIPPPARTKGARP